MGEIIQEIKHILTVFHIFFKKKIEFWSYLFQKHYFVKEIYFFYWYQERRIKNIKLPIRVKNQINIHINEQLLNYILLNF